MTHLGKFDYITAISWYCAFGMAHESSHLATAILVGVTNHKVAASNWKSLLIDAIFHRQTRIPCAGPATDLCSDSGTDWRLLAIRHVGWLSSLLVAILVCYYKDANAKSLKKNKEKYLSGSNNLCKMAAMLTAMDAIATDLLGLGKLSLGPRNLFLPINPAGDSIVLHCGNFGIILLSGAWFGKGGNTALDILEKMIQVTMMRGAQSGKLKDPSPIYILCPVYRYPNWIVLLKQILCAFFGRSSIGGVVTFDSETKGDSDKKPSPQSMVGTRTRIVKSKREDLSKVLRSKIQQRSRGVLASAMKHVKFFAGHTRFATSSKASFDGTHPHQWSKPRSCRVYKMDELRADNTSNAPLNLSLSRLRQARNRRSIAAPFSTRVENFITHNGDFEFYELNGKVYEVETIQRFLEHATETKMPAVVDSAAIAGMIDLIRCQGCFGLSVRYAICLGLSTSQIPEHEEDFHLPTYRQYELIGEIFEECLKDFQNENTFSLEVIGSKPDMRETLARNVTEKLNALENQDATHPLNLLIGNEESGSGIYAFATTTISAFFDNDLLHTVKIFLAHAKGSFGLCVTTSLDSHRQMCLAARGQTISVAFHPQTDLIIYGSEQAAVKAGLGIFPPSIEDSSVKSRLPYLDLENDVLRLDLDDVGGEICLLDWGKQYSTVAVSPPNRELKSYHVMNGKVEVILLQETSTIKQPESLHQRMTVISSNPLITSLKEDSDDLIRQDIQDIPQVCQSIQKGWRNINSKSDDSYMFNMNRLTAWNLGKCLKERLEQYDQGHLEPCPNRVDILLTGCEVSLWVAEQFASDLQKSFPKLRIVAMSSNKLLGLYGQDEINIPTVGFSASDKSLNLFDAITIIVSHSGGTFAPLGCSSLFQSTTKNIFVVTSEWDTQIGKQLRSIDNDDGLSWNLLYNSRIFSTGVGMRPAEPCSVSVVATHQLLTSILEFISIVVLSDDRYRNVTGAVITERDIRILERCNRDNLYALSQITEEGGETEQELRAAGDIWAEHILENVKAYIMTFVYIVATVVSGYPIVSGIANGVGLDNFRLSYFLRFLDSLIYFFLPQINVIILRLIQRRPLRHRMVGRTVVIGDVPWVAQSAEAFLSKIFASSYSIAGLNVHSANPSDHLVHRMTHRVVRGSLLICGRPDGRLSALTAMESAVCLSINQASSIQSLGSTCESVTIGHNPFKLPLSARGIFLNRNRPLFLCEKLLGEDAAEDGMDVSISSSRRSLRGSSHHRRITAREESPSRRLTGISSREPNTFLDETLTRLRKLDNQNGPRPGRVLKKVTTPVRSSAALLGAYKTLEHDTIRKLEHDHFMDESRKVPFKTVLAAAIQEKKWSDSARSLFEMLDLNKDTVLDLNEFVKGLSEITDKSEADLSALFHQL